MNVFERLKEHKREAAPGATTALAAPLSGALLRLEDAPDEAFAGGMVGEGLAIDPTSSVLSAPCDGVIVSVSDARHAVVIRAPNGAEILLHIGIETVSLNGAGFTVRVHAGESVKQGAPLIDFDMDAVALKAKSLVSPIILLSDEEFQISRRAGPGEIAQGDFLMAVTAKASSGAPAQAGAQIFEAEGTVIVRAADGIHARPAAAIVAAAKPFSSEIELVAGANKANAKSVSSLMKLGARGGARLTARARGEDARRAVAAVCACFQGEDAAPQHAAKANAAAISKTPPATTKAAVGALTGVKAAPGLAIGAAFRLDNADIEIEEESAGADAERAALQAGLDRVLNGLARLAQSEGPQSKILAAHIGILNDPDIADFAHSLIDAGKSAGFAWREAMRREGSVFRAMDDARMAERAADFVDLERQVLVALNGEALDGPSLPEGAVVIAGEIFPSQLLRLDLARIAGLCTARGGPTSHASILAASMGIPTVVALGEAILAVSAGAPVIVDADGATVCIDPGPEKLASAREKIAQRRRRRSAAEACAKEECRTADGTRILALANLASREEARLAAENSAEGCGLLRTEFLFLNRRSPPREEDQLEDYQAIADALGPRPLVIRTLDVGADKAVPYLALEREENPALGLRGVRVSLARPDLLEAQLRAILRMKTQEPLRIMIPMIASLSELRAVRAMLDKARADLGAPHALLGVMVETPAAAILADQLAREADFFSIGTNDLAQYALAMERDNPHVAAGLDGLGPAILRLIKGTADAAAKTGTPVGVCGGLASDFAAVPFLIGLGVRSLSGAAARIPELKAFIRTLRTKDCRAAAMKAVDFDDAASVRALARKTWPQLDDWA